MISVGYSELFKLVLPEVIVVAAALIALASKNRRLVHSIITSAFPARSPTVVFTCARAIRNVATP